MNTHTETFGTFKDETGETYYCPLGGVSDNRIVSDEDFDNCVEASTVGRYSGNLNVIDRFTS